MSGRLLILLFFAVFLEVFEADHAAVFLVVEAVFGAGNACAYIQCRDLLEEGFCMVTFFQTVVGNTGAEVVDVVETDISGEPLEDFRQLVIRTAFERGGGKVPVVMTCPINILELVLDIKHPDSRSGGDQADAELEDEVFFPSHEPDTESDNGGNTEVCPENG